MYYCPECQHAAVEVDGDYCPHCVSKLSKRFRPLVVSQPNLDAIAKQAYEARVQEYRELTGDYITCQPRV